MSTDKSHYDESYYVIFHGGVEDLFACYSYRDYEDALQDYIYQYISDFMDHYPKGHVLTTEEMERFDLVAAEIPRYPESGRAPRNLPIDYQMYFLQWQAQRDSWEADAELSEYKHYLELKQKWEGKEPPK
tara:strand:- start:41770 stop:42159 length:390 start_codon:yes stop_codon:yes gene_type:complete